MNTTAQDGVTAALATGIQPKPPSPLAASLTFWWRAMLKIKHRPEQIIDVTIFPVVFLLIFTFLFGGAVSGSTGSYLDRAFPGILAMTVIFLTMYTGLSLNRDVSKCVHDRFRVLPIWQPAAIVGPLLSDVVRYLTAATVMLGLGLALGFRPAAGVVGTALAVALILLFAFSLSWLWSLLGLLVRTESTLNTVSTAVLMPAALVSDVFVPVDTMPGWLQSVASVNPMSSLAAATRGLMDGVGPTSDVFLVLVFCVALVIVFGPLTMIRYRRVS